MQSIKVKDYLNHRPVTFTDGMRIEQAVEKLLQSGQSGGLLWILHIKLLGSYLSKTVSKKCLRRPIKMSHIAW